MSSTNKDFAVIFSMDWLRATCAIVGNRMITLTFFYYSRIMETASSELDHVITDD